MPDPFRTDLRAHYLALQSRFQDAERGSPVYWALERAMGATDRLHVALYGEPIQRVHSAGGGARGLVDP